MPPASPLIMSKPSVSPVALAFQVMVSLPVPASDDVVAGAAADRVATVAGIDVVIAAAASDRVDGRVADDDLAGSPPVMLAVVTRLT